ncbi:5676_t:CDS:2, partial [Acaulospora colombiana]
WESSKDKRKVAELFKPDTLDKASERTLRFLLEQISKILPHATNLHIVDIAMTWAKPLFQSPRPSNAEITALCVLFRQALLLHRHLYDERWTGLWNRYSRRGDTPPMTPRSPVSSHHTAVVRSPHSRQNTLTNKI